jgi:hypothetical protein
VNLTLGVSVILCTRSLRSTDLAHAVVTARPFEHGTECKLCETHRDNQLSLPPRAVVHGASTASFCNRSLMHPAPCADIWMSLYTSVHDLHSASVPKLAQC